MILHEVGGAEENTPKAIVIIDGMAQRKNSLVGGSFSKISESMQLS